MTVSLWQREATRRIETEVAIIGGGLCGLGAAHACKEAGVDWQLLEQAHPGWGASGRNAGYLIRGAAENYARAGRRLGREPVKALWGLTEANIARLESHGLTKLPSFERRPSVILAYSEVEALELQESAAMMSGDGFDVEMLTGGEDSLWQNCPPKAALCNPGDAIVNPVELIEALADQAGRDQIHEGVEVHSIDSVDGSSGGVEVRARDLVVRARHALVCTNAWAPLLLEELRDEIIPRRGQMLALRAEGASLDAGYYSNFGSEYFRPGPDGLLIFGGCRLADEAGEVGYEDVTTPVIQFAIESFARQVVGSSFEVVARWAGTMGFSPTGLPITQEVRPDVWFCGGFTGHGMSMAVETAHRAVARILGLSDDQG